MFLPYILALIASQLAGQPSPPSDWWPLVDHGDMVWTGDLPYPSGWLTPGYYPVLGNGYLAVEAGPFVMPYVNSWPWRDAGSVHIAGLNSGQGFGNGSVAPSHRAQVPSFINCVISQPESGENRTYSRRKNSSFVNLGAAIDFYRATYFNRTVVSIPGECENVLIEMRTYCHRSLRRLIVLEIEAKVVANGLPWNGPCRLPVAWDLESSNTSETGSSDLEDWVRHDGVAGGRAVSWTAVNRVQEEQGLPPTEVTMVVSSLLGLHAPTHLLFNSSGAIHRFIVSYATNISNDGNASSLEEAVTAWEAAEAMSSSALWREHQEAWAALWGTAGIEVAGNGSFAGVINSSLYDIASSMRYDWPWSTSPGGLGTNGYNGHTFWDMETWMFPVLVVLFPEMALNAIRYRTARLEASMQRAANNGYSGAFWAWESAITGLDTAPWREADINENHISADIPLAWRSYYYATGDMTTLQSQWNALRQTCIFWECRFTRVDSNTSAPPPAGFGSRCSAKDGTGNFTVRGVICPDEGSGIVNDSAYTNAAAAATLLWCVEAAELLNESVPDTWLLIGRSPYIPLTDALDPSQGPVHQEYTGYNGWRLINQADVALLQYPLGLDFPADLAKRDLDYWSSVTNFAGMFTGDASYAAAYLALGDRSAADRQLAAVWAHIEPHFNVFMETADGSGTQHFITGSGGLLQNVLFGYAGLRIERPGALSFSSQRPVVPSMGVESVRLRGLHLLGNVLNLWFNNSAICVVLQENSPSDTPPVAVLEMTSRRQTRIDRAELCVANGPIEIVRF
jgi:hypothetical protein